MINFQNFIDYFDKSPLIIQLVWMAILVMFFLVVVVIFDLFILRRSLRKKQTRIKKLNKLFETLLVDYLYSGEPNEKISEQQQKIVDKIQSLLATKLNKKQCVISLEKLKNEISGEMAMDVQKLYFQLNLKKYAIANLKSRNWYIVAKAIKELSTFNVSEAQQQIATFLQHKKKEVAKEAQLYFVKLFNFKGLDFLNTLTTPLTEWDQIQLLSELQNFDNQQLPDCTAWLQSTNDTIVLFTLKLANIYNQFQLKDEIIKLLIHQNTAIRVQSIELLGNWQVTEIKPLLKETFELAPTAEKLAFLQLLENTLEPDDIPFLVENSTHLNFSIQYESLKMLKTISQESFQKVVQHAENKRIANYINNN